MILSKEEKNHIKIWRLLKKISVKHGEGYYSLDVNPKEVNTKYYLPKVSHCNYDSAEETIASLENLLDKNTYEYTLDFDGMVKALAKKKKEKDDLIQELEGLEEAYNRSKIPAKLCKEVLCS